jgi:hypothetical protein
MMEVDFLTVDWITNHTELVFNSGSLNQERLISIEPDPCISMCSEDSASLYPKSPWRGELNSGLPSK